MIGISSRVSLDLSVANKISQVGRLLGLICFVVGLGCSTGSGSKDSDKPAWIHQPTRTVDAGYIVYLGVGEDRSLSQANFKAQSEAIVNIANECSFAPKGARVEDQFQDSVGVIHRVYVKAAVSFQDCEAAQRTVDPGEIRNLANASFTQELKRYQDLLDHEAEEESKQPTSSLLASEGTPVDVGVENGSPGQPHVGYYVMRQQLAYAKEVVILSPPATYSAGSSQNVQFVSSVRPVTMQVAQYQVVHPEVRSMNQGWTNFHSYPAVPALQGVKGMRADPVRHMNYYHSSSQAYLRKGGSGMRHPRGNFSHSSRGKRRRRY